MCVEADRTLCLLADELQQQLDEQDTSDTLELNKTVRLSHVGADGDGFTENYPMLYDSLRNFDAKAANVVS